MIRYLLNRWWAWRHRCRTDWRLVNLPWEMLDMGLMLRRMHYDNCRVCGRLTCANAVPKRGTEVRR